MSRIPRGKKDESVAQIYYLRQSLLGLKILASGMVIGGFFLVIWLSILGLAAWLEWMILAIFGISAGGFLIARSRSLVRQYETVYSQQDQSSVDDHSPLEK